jgi:hypothetical protein
MTSEEFQEYLRSLPPEVQAALADALKPLGDYAARAAEVRDRIAEEFPKLNPPLRAVLSLALARYR